MSNSSLLLYNYIIMEDTELAPAEFADSGDDSVSAVSFNSRTLELMEIITQESKDNPDMLAHAGQSMRELIEKAYYVIGEVSDKSQDPSTLAEGDKRRIQISILIVFFIGNGGQTSEQIIDAQTDAILELRQYFVEIAHHSSTRNTTTIEEMKQKITEMEKILFNLVSPQPIEDLEELDALIAQGEVA